MATNQEIVLEFSKPLIVEVDGDQVVIGKILPFAEPGLDVFVLNSGESKICNQFHLTLNRRGRHVTAVLGG